MAYLKNRTFSTYVKGIYKTFEIKIVNDVEQYVISTKQKNFFLWQLLVTLIQVCGTSFLEI